MPWIRTILAFVNDTPTQNRGTWVKVTGLTTYGLASSRMVVGPIYGIGESGKQSLGSSDARETNRLAPHERVSTRLSRAKLHNKARGRKFCAGLSYSRVSGFNKTSDATRRPGFWLSMPEKLPIFGHLCWVFAGVVPGSLGSLARYNRQVRLIREA